MAKLYILHGFVGAGKTTFAKKLESETGAFRFSPDEWIETLYGKNPPADLYADYDNRIKMLIWQMAEKLLQAGQDVILDMGFWSRKGRDKARVLAAKTGAEPILYHIDCDIDVMRERVRARTNEASEGALFIDDNAFNSFLDRLEPLGDDEERITERT